MRSLLGDERNDDRAEKGKGQHKKEVTAHDLLLPAYSNIVSIQDHEKIEKTGNPGERVPIFKRESFEVSASKLKAFRKPEKRRTRMQLGIRGNQPLQKIGKPHPQLSEQCKQRQWLLWLILPDLGSKTQAPVKEENEYDKKNNASFCTFQQYMS